MSKRLALLLSTALISSLASGPLYAQPRSGSVDMDALLKRLEPLERLVKSQQKELEEQKEKIARQERELQSYKNKINAPESKPVVHGEEPQEAIKKPKTKIAESTAAKQEPVVVASETTTVPARSSAKEEKSRPEINVLPDAGGVLTPKGVLMYENSAEYTNTTTNIFSFDGLQIAQVVLVGNVVASSARRNVLQDSSRLRMGVLDRLEADVRVPYVYRNDATSTTVGNVTSKASIEGNGIGDIDGGLAYQINRGRSGWPFFVGNVRYKSNTGTGPFDVAYDANNIAKELPTGTGFNSVEGSVTMIKVTDPAVLFTNLGYVHSFGKDINKTYNTTLVQKVSPGGVFNASIGMGFSINQDTSFTLGYKHSYVLSTYQRAIDTTNGSLQKSRSDALNVGSLQVGASYRVTPSINLNFTADVGATRDAPDVHVGFRLPLQVAKFY